MVKTIPKRTAKREKNRVINALIATIDSPVVQEINKSCHETYYGIILMVNRAWNNFKKSIKTIRSKIDEYEISFPLIPPSETIIIMDTTYFRRGFGVMVFYDHWGCKYALRYYVKTETVHLYRQGINTLKLRGREIKGIVCDGRRGLFKAFSGSPMQMCHFHQ